ECKKEISDAAPTCPHCGSPVASSKRSVGILLGIGIFLFPLIFSWFTLRTGHSTVARAVSFVWLAFCVIVLFAQSPKTPSATASSQAAATADSQPAEASPQEQAVD